MLLVVSILVFMEVARRVGKTVNVIVHMKVSILVFMEVARRDDSSYSVSFVTYLFQSLFLWKSLVEKATYLPTLFRT